jgi:hypothetical protein
MHQRATTILIPGQKTAAGAFFSEEYFTRAGVGSAAVSLRFLNKQLWKVSACPNGRRGDDYLLHTYQYRYMVRRGLGRSLNGRRRGDNDVLGMVQRSTTYSRSN